MQYLTGFLIFLYGIIFGSFYNVIIYRVPLDISIAKGRSFCPNCKTQLKAKDLVPVFSQLFLRNKCRYCGQGISLRYPAIELATGLLFLLSYFLNGFGWLFFVYAAFWSMLLITAMIDLDHMIISDALLLVFSLVPAAYLIFADVDYKDHLLGLAVGFGLYLIIFLVVFLVYRWEAFGFGDVLFMGAAGLVLGLWKTVVASLLSFYIGLLVIIVMKLAGKKVSKKLEIPFGPFVCVSAFLTSIFGDQIIDIYVKLFF